MSYSWHPVCGTGLFLIEAIDLIDEKLRLTRLASSELAASRNRSAERLFGVEFNSQVAELAATNLMLNGLPPTQIVTGNSLRSETFEGTSLHGLQQREFDVMALDPPIGGWEEDPRLIWASEIVRKSGKVPQEALLMERALRLLRPGGRLAVLVPDSVLAAASYRYFREWLLQHVAVHMIISLPVETFRPVGHSGKASLLLLEKLPGRSSNQVVLVADVRSIGYDRSGDSIATNDLPTLLEVIRTYRDEGIVAEKLEPNQLRVWQVHSHELSADRFDISHLDRGAPDPIMLIQRAQYPFGGTW